MYNLGRMNVKVKYVMKLEGTCGNKTCDKIWWKYERNILGGKWKK